MSKALAAVGILLALALIIFLFGHRAPSPKAAINDSNCSALEPKVKELLSSYNYCTTSSDCAILDIGCQLGCYGLANKNADLNQIRILARQYREENCKACNFECLTPPNKTDISCITGRCIDNRHCANLEVQFSTLLEQSIYCNYDSDCVAVDVSCQFGCFVLVNEKSNLDKLKNMSKEYSLSGCEECNGTCAAAPKVSNIGCERRKCMLRG